MAILGYLFSAGVLGTITLITFSPIILISGYLLYKAFKLGKK